ncbi:MAG: SGNH/GDSL hydrolase family protein [Planctomycetaceae bacterium]|nr:SGNH/GDSL hydrolase family protein [Planctomycetaceae bacterium]
MTRCEPPHHRPCLLCFVQTLLVLAVGMAPIPATWARARSALESARSPELNRADREATAGGYYEGLLGGVDTTEGTRFELMLRLLGKPTDWNRFRAANVSRHLPDDFLMFELQPNTHRSLFGQPFTTNAHGMRDRGYAVAKPAGTFRVAVLGSSMDMGWGVGADEMYVNLLEDWLNLHAERLGLGRRFEVLNFAVAAYSPMQRLEAYRRKARQFHPDLVIYSATMLDVRLLEIHLCDMLQARVDLRYDFVREAVAAAGITAADLALDSKERLLHKDDIKRKLRPFYWSIYDDTMGTLAADCRAAGVPLAFAIIPRVGLADAPNARANAVIRLRGIAEHHALPVLDLSHIFDHLDPGTLEIAAWDDHPNALGHRRLFLGLARALVKDRALYNALFHVDEARHVAEGPRPEVLKE